MGNKTNNCKLDSFSSCFEVLLILPAISHDPAFSANTTYVPKWLKEVLTGSGFCYQPGWFLLRVWAWFLLRLLLLLLLLSRVSCLSSLFCDLFPVRGAAYVAFRLLHNLERTPNLVRSTRNYIPRIKTWSKHADQGSCTFGIRPERPVRWCSCSASTEGSPPCTGPCTFCSPLWFFCNCEEYLNCSSRQGLGILRLILFLILSSGGFKAQMTTLTSSRSFGRVFFRSGV